MKKVIVAIAALAAFAPAAEAATNFVKVTPNSVGPGQQVHVYGTVTGCRLSNQVIITSGAFKGATKHTFAGKPALYLKQNQHHKFSARPTIANGVQAGTYRVSGRCGGGNFGHVTLQITPGFY